MISLQFLLTAFVVVIAPGTGVVYTLALGLGRGRAAAIAAATGCTFGILPHLAAATLGLAALLHTSALLFSVVKWAGVVYLLWLAWGALRQTGTLAVQPADARGQGLTRIAVQGALINVLNPKLSIFFLAFLPQFAEPAHGAVAPQVIACGALFALVTLVVFGGVAWAAGFLGERLGRSGRAQRIMNRAAGAVFVALALRLVTVER